MKNNIVPALIIAASLIVVAFISRQNGASQVQATLNQLELAAQQKDAEGKSQLSRIASGLARSVGDGLKEGFRSGDQTDATNREMELHGKIVITQVKIVSGRQKNQEKVIGIVRNEGTDTARNISLNVLFRDANGGLLDVASRFSHIQGILKPGEELGFEVDRDLGGFQENEDVLAQRKAASVVVSLAGFSMVK